MTTAVKTTLAVLLLGLLLIGALLTLESGDVDDIEGPSEPPAPDRRSAPELLSHPAEPEARASPPASPSASTDVAVTGVAAGIVRDALTRQPISDARVRVFGARGGLSAPLGATSTDTQGRFRLDLRALESRGPLFVAITRVRIHVSAAGYRPSRDTLRDVPDAPPLCWKAVEIELQPGAAVVGRVVDPLEAPVAAAQVALRRVDGGVHPTHHGWTEADGRFEVGLDDAGHYAGRVEVENVGIADVDRFAVESSGTIDLGDLQLVGPGSISGVLRYPDGTPAAYAKAAAWAVPAEANKGAAHDPAVGLLTSRARSDEQGQFVLSGLTPGAYYVADAAERPRGAARTQPGDWPIHTTGDEDISVVVRGHRVVLRVQDADGNPLPGAGYSISWKTQKVGDQEDGSAGTLQDVDGILTLRGRPGERIEISVKAGDAGLAEFVVEIRADVWHVQQDLVPAPPPTEVGTLRIAALLDDRGRPIESAFLTVTTQRTDALVRYDVPLPADGRLGEIPVGAYRIEVFPGRTHKQRRDELWFPILREFEIRAHAETALEFQAVPAARLRLTISGEGLQKDDRRALDSLRAFAVPAGGGEELSLGGYFTVMGSGHWLRGGARARAPALSMRPFESGAYTLRVELDGFRRFERQVRLDAGAILDVDVSLQRK